MSFGDFRRTMYRNKADRVPPAAPNRWRPVLLLVALLAAMAWVVWFGFGPLLE